MSVTAGVSSALGAAGDETHDKASYTRYCHDVVFRETPYADIRCASETRRDTIGAAKHFQLDYDGHGRLTEIRHVQNGELRAYSDRFVRAPRTKIAYEGKLERRIYFNEYGSRTLVSGDVYETRITLDDNGNRLALKFYGLDGAPVENDFAIASYAWTTANDGDITEHRYRLDGTVQRNRPGFGYFVTRFHYNARGLLRRMVNLGADGAEETPDDAGIVATQLGYDQNGRFTQWLNLGVDDKPRRGMSAIAEIRYQPSPFSGEQIAWFFDADGSPQTTRWGAHIVSYEFDEFGNETQRAFSGVDGEPVNAGNGVGKIVSEWTQDGAYRVARTYFDKAGAPVGVGDARIHTYRTAFDDAGRPVRTTSFNLANAVTVDPGTGFATVENIFDDAGRLVERRYLDAEGALTDHAEWGVARFVSEYADNGELISSTAYKKSGEVARPMWNPQH